MDFYQVGIYIINQVQMIWAVFKSVLIHLKETASFVLLLVVKICVLTASQMWNNYVLQ